MKLSRFKTKYWIATYIMLGFCLIISAISWLSSSFCDFYTYYITPVIVNTYGRFMGLFPFSVGEIMALIAVNSLLVVALLWIPFVVLKRKNKKENIRRGIKKFYAGYLHFALLVGVIMTLNCTTFYHCTPLDPNPDLLVEDRKEVYTVDDIIKIYSYLSKTANELAWTFPRDENNRLLPYEGDLQKECTAALINISDRYKKLDGYYPHYKEMAFSWFDAQMYIGGYYYPFSVEANITNLMYEPNYPGTICHELSHLRGYIYEDEANFLSFVALEESGNDYFVYCGILDVLNYLRNDIYKNIAAIAEVDPDYEYPHPEYVPDEIVRNDCVFVLDEVWDKEVKKETINNIVSEEKIDEINNTLSDASMKLNGVELGMASYGEVVKRLLVYYDGKLY